MRKPSLGQFSRFVVLRAPGPERHEESEHRGDDARPIQHRSCRPATQRLAGRRRKQKARAIRHLMYIFSALPITACAMAMGRVCRRSAPCSASSALLERRSSRLADGLQVDVAGRDTLRIAARRTCVFAVSIIRPWPWSPVYEPPASGDRHHRQRSALQHG